MDGHGGVGGLCIYALLINRMEVLLIESLIYPVSPSGQIAQLQFP